MEQKRRIIYRNNIVFGDTQKLDLKIIGHPTLNISDDVNGEMYFFLITSSRVQKDKDLYYKIPKNKNNKLIKQSYIDLRYIYKKETINKVGYGLLAENQYRSIIKKFIEQYNLGKVKYTEEQQKLIDEFFELEEPKEIKETYEKNLAKQREFQDKIEKLKAENREE